MVVYPWIQHFLHRLRSHDLLLRLTELWRHSKSKHRPRNDIRLYGGNIPFVQTGDIKNCGHILENYSQTYITVKHKNL